MPLLPTNGNGETVLSKNTRLTISIVICIVIAISTISAFVYGKSTTLAIIETKVTSLEDNIMPKEEIKVYMESIDTQLNDIKDDVNYIRDKLG